MTILLDDLKTKVELYSQMQDLYMQYLEASGMIWLITCQHHTYYPQDTDFPETCDCRWVGAKQIADFTGMDI